MKDYPIVGLVGVHHIGSQSVSIHAGKDEFCTAFTQAMSSEGFRVTRRAFADCLKEDLAKMLGVTVKFINENKQLFRLMMQGYGTDYCRTLLGADCWIKRLDAWLNENADVELTLSRMDGQRFALVVPDCRLQNEIDYIRQQGGVVVRVVRHSAADYPLPKGHRSHSSELVDGLQCDYEVLNASLPAFRQEIARFTKKVYLPAYYAKRRKLGVVNDEGQTVSRVCESCGSRN